MTTEHTPDTAADHAEFIRLVDQLAADDHLPPLYAEPWRYRGRWVLCPGHPMRDVTALLAWAGELDEGGFIARVEYPPGYRCTWVTLTGRLGGQLVMLSGCTHRRIPADGYGIVADADLNAAAAAELLGVAADDVLAAAGSSGSGSPDPDPPPTEAVPLVRPESPP